jgi:hypothetical protein
MSAKVPKLHLDADASSKALQQALLRRGYDVTQTPNEWMRADASDEGQLLGATSQGRLILTYNIRDFQILASRYIQHAGILSAAQRSFSLRELIEFLDQSYGWFLSASTTTAGEWIGRVRWLSDWRDG